MNESILANRLRYSNARGALQGVNPVDLHRPTEAELKERAEWQVKEAKRDEACTVIALAEKLFLTKDITADKAFELAQELTDKAGSFFESRL
jgi:hypothetical protein